MIGVADENGRTYVSNYGTYNKETGFVLYDEYKWYRPIEDVINKLFHENCWSLKEEKPKQKVMTKEEIEAALGYEIEIKDKNNLKFTSKNGVTKYIDEINGIEDILTFLFGK